MTNLIPYRLRATLAFLVVCLPLLTNAQVLFTDTEQGDVNVAFRKTGAHQEAYEMVVYAGNITNFMGQVIGTTVTITNYNSAQLSTMCPDGLGNLQWSVFSTFDGTLDNYWGNYGNNPVEPWPASTCWYTVPRTNVNVQTTTPTRLTSAIGNSLHDKVIAVSGGANGVSQQLFQTQGNTNNDNNTLVVLEPINLEPADNLTTFIGDPDNSAVGDFYGYLPSTAENTTPNSFTTPVISDFYVNVPTGSKVSSDIDPLTGLKTGSADYLGYFTFSPSGTLTFTRAVASTAPSVSSVTATVTNGFGPLTVVFSDTISGSATNWVWNFGNGIMVTNTTGGNVTNTYTTAGDYTVTLTVYGAGGSSTDTVANYIVALPHPKISFAVINRNLVFTGTNCPPNVQYRVLSSTNLMTALANWKPVYTNTFGGNGAFAYTNGLSGTNSFFILVSP